MSAPAERALREEYASRHRRGVDAIRLDRHAEALESFQSALRIAEMLADRHLEHQARANISMAYLQLGEVKKAEAGLREILLTTTDPKIRFGAAYNLASSLRKQSRYAKAHSYAVKAFRCAFEARDANARASCHNLIGNILMNESRLDESLVEYRRALRIRRGQREDARFSIGILLDNIGYVWLLQRRLRRGETIIRRALAIQTDVGAQYSIAECLQDLCYARLLMGDYPEATRLGERALDLAASQGYTDILKNCHYLLGETAHLDGRTEDRDHHFDRLQGMHPELPFLRDFLCAFDVSGIITLKH